MTKILMFELDDMFGGIESFILNMLSNINFDDEIMIDVISSKKEIACENEFLKYPIQIIKTPSKSNVLAYWFALNRIVKNGNYNIIHIQKNSLTNNIPVIIAEKYKIPYILHAQNSASTYNNVITRFLHSINKLLNKKKSFIKMACGENAAKWMFGSTDRVIFVKNGINPHEFLLDLSTREEIRTKLQIQDKTVLCHVGRFSAQKNQEFLIDVFDQYLNIDHNSMLFLVGDGPLLTKIKMKVKEKKIDDSVVFFGSLKRDKEREILMASDIFVLPSLYEGVSIASVEAQMVGLQLLVSDSVDSATNITGNVLFLSLDDSADTWARVINEITSRKNISYDQTQILSYIRNAGYDMCHTTECLVKLYKNGINFFSL